MAITSTEAVKFSDEFLRPSADRLAKAFYRSQITKDQWDALSGTDAEKLALMPANLLKAANRLFWTYRFVIQARQLWDALNMQALIPNDAAEVLWDNLDNTGPDPSRPTVTGEDLRRVNWRIEEYVNWLHYDPLVTDPVFLQDGNITTEVFSEAGIKDVLKMSEDGFAAPTGTHAANLVTRCGELVTELETTNPFKLTHILAVSVNPED